MFRTYYHRDGLLDTQSVVWAGGLEYPLLAGLRSSIQFLKNTLFDILYNICYTLIVLLLNLKTAVDDDEEPQDIDAERFEAIEGFIYW